MGKQYGIEIDKGRFVSVLSEIGITPAKPLAFDTKGEAEEMAQNLEIHNYKIKKIK